MSRHQPVHLAPVTGVEIPADMQAMIAHIDALDPLIHQPTRLRLLAVLSKQPDAINYQTLKEWLRLRTSNLSAQVKLLEQAGLLTLPMCKNRGFSVQHSGHCHCSLTGLPGPKNISGGVVVPMQACTTARVPPNGQAFLDYNAAARAYLARIGRRHNYGSLSSVLSFESKDGAELTPARVSNALGEMVVLHQVGDLQIFVKDVS